MRRFLAFFLLLAAGPGAAGAAPVWQVDPSSSTIAVAIVQGGQKVEARVAKFSGNIRFDPQDLAGSAVEIRVDIASFTSGDTNRDGQATGSAWLDAKDHEQAIYRTRAFRAKGGDVYEIDADLT